MNPDLTLGENDLPAVFRAADAATAAAQHQVVRRTQLQIAALIGAAAVGSLGSFRPKSGSNWASIVGADATWIGIAAAGLLLGGAFIRLQGLGEFEKRWYEGRALAESAKTLAWRYAVGAVPFRLDQADADKLYISRIRAIITDSDSVILRSAVRIDSSEITPAMRELRAAPLDVRRETYRVGRIDDQMTWYRTKAQHNEKRSSQWSTVALFFEAGGIFSGILLAAEVISFNLLGLVPTVGSGIIAWVKLRQHATLARAYSLTAFELSAVSSLIDSIGTEDDWARFVEDAEGAISRESTMWAASHAAVGG
ncbi:MAG: DUF4231 domain-containing protein [Acidimicrobiales bacterium]